jgi:hypothetical protein
MINIVTDDMTNALHSTVCICRYVLNLVFVSFICCMTVSISVDLWKVEKEKKKKRSPSKSEFYHQDAATALNLIKDHTKAQHII